MENLSSQHCVPCEGGIPPLDQAQAQKLIQSVDNWELTENYTRIERKFTFKNYYQTMAFVNAVAYIAHQENHHPDLEVGYNYCTIRYNTHAVGGLSQNDFICAAKIDGLLKK